MEEELLKSIKRMLNSAELVYNTKDYTPAGILYFKIWFSVLDFLIYQRFKLTPKDHNERFRILEKNFPEEYKMLDKYYKDYRSTYSITLDIKTCEEIRKYVGNTIKKNFGI